MKEIKLGIHLSKWGFSSHWVDYCQKNNIPYKIVDCYASDIIEQLQDCDALLWHYHHALTKDSLFAKQLLTAVEHSNKVVFPEHQSGWHFDDKIAQKYLLESINAPFAKSWVFYDKNEAQTWLNKAEFPLVFKLRKGAGSCNVQLIKNRAEGKKIIRKIFSKGIPVYDRIGDLTDNWKKFKRNRSNSKELLKSIRRLYFSTEFARVSGREKSYVYFQEFLPGNTFDIRVITIGNKAFAIKRMVRENDFRASGSGMITYDYKEIDPRCITVAFQVSEKLNASCLAYDFVFDKNNQPLIVEINYGFDFRGYQPCRGYWDKNLKWYEEHPFNPMHWMVEEVIRKINHRKNT